MSGVTPRWRADGTELFYRTDEGIVVVPVRTDGDDFDFEPARTLFQGLFRGGTSGIAFGGRYGVRWDFDVAPDGQSFIMFPAAERDHLAEVVVVTNFLSEIIPSGVTASR